MATAALVQFRVVGTPIAQGSMRAWQNPKAPLSRPFVVADNANELRRWRATVASSAAFAWGGRPLEDGPIMVSLSFFLDRPPTGPRRIWPTHGSLDLDKLVRAVLDGMTKTVITNDARVVRIETKKSYVEPPTPPGVLVTVFSVV